MTAYHSDISIIIPFFNEQDNINNLRDELTLFINNNPHISFELILVNDGSTDMSKELILAASFGNNAKLINFSKNFGSHAALRAGITKASGKYITFIYADLQDPLNNILKMHDLTEKGNDIVWAYRSQTENSFFERVFSKLYGFLMRHYVSTEYPKFGFDVVMFTRKIADNLNLNIESNSSLFLQILTMGFKSDSIEYKKLSRYAGKSKWSVSKKIKLLIDSFVAFSFAPIRFVSITGILFFLTGVFWTLYIIFRKIFFNDLEPGWPALISILMIGFGITNISLGIIAEYLWRTLDASRKRFVFIIDEIIDLSINK